MSKGKDVKPHIGIFGRRNNGKSSFINSLTKQDTAIVSETPGTTTDPVKKSIEVFGIGPVVLIDTAGIDDSGEIGGKRIKKSLETIKIVDCAVLIISDNLFGEFELNLINEFNDNDVPFIILHNKADIEKLSVKTISEIRKYTEAGIIEYSTRINSENDEIFQLLKNIIPQNSYQNSTPFSGLLNKNEIVVLVTPIDNEAPEGRMILPQVIAIRDVLDHDCINIVLKETELEYFFKKTHVIPDLVVTDSQAFGLVSKIVPENIPLTSFSILFARLKGDFEAYLAGTPSISKLKDGDKVLLLESCTHVVNCDDIGKFKIPKWLTGFTKKELQFEFITGFDQIRHDILEYALVVQCGGCMFSRKQVLNRLKPAILAGIPVTNYGMSIAYVHGIFNRATAIFNKQKQDETVF